jgi:hypothetical protein
MRVCAKLCAICEEIPSQKPEPRASSSPIANRDSGQGSGQKGSAEAEIRGEWQKTNGSSSLLPLS